jgi:hypothetical protein
VQPARTSLVTSEDPSPYEQLLRANPGMAMSESSRFFEGSSKLHDSLRTLAKQLDVLGIPYAVVGGMALTAHGFARMTDDIDVLVTRADLKRLHDAVVGRGYRRVFEGSKSLRDTRTGVKIEFLLAGDFPGSGKPQPLSFPSPSQTERLVHEGVSFIGLARLVELKLASGMTGGVDRARDLVDVQRLIDILHLPREFSADLHEYVRPEYEKIWDALRATRKRWVRLWKLADSLAEAELASAHDELRRMREAGVVSEPTGREDVVRLVTDNPDVAREFGMHDESEFFDENP